MIKYKASSVIVNDEKYIEYLNKMDQKEWKLDRVGYFHQFSKSDRHYKYQVDFKRPDPEYLEVLESQGYQRVECSKDYYIYRNKNLYAPDIHTDPEVLKMTKLRFLDLETPAGLIFLGMIFFLIGGGFDVFKIFEGITISFYGLKKLISGLFVCFFSMFLILEGLDVYITMWKIKHDYKLNFIPSFMEFYRLFFQFILIVYILDVYIVIWLESYIYDKNYHKIKQYKENLSEEKRKLFEIVIFVVRIAFTFGLIYIVNKIEKNIQYIIFK